MNIKQGMQKEKAYAKVLKKIQRLEARLAYCRVMNMDSRQVQECLMSAYDEQDALHFVPTKEQKAHFRYNRM